MTTLFDIELYHQPEIQGYKSDWDGAFYDPAWDEPDGLPEILQNKVAVDEEVLEERKGKVGSDEISSDCWNSAHFGEVPRKFDEAGNPMVFWDESIEPPDPDDFESNHEYEQAWLCWEKENSDSLTYVAELEQGFPSGESSPEKSNYADCAKPTNGVEKYCSNASQMSPSTETCATSNLEREKSIALHHHHHANLLPLKENVSPPQTRETVSPQYYDLSQQPNLNSSVSKTSPDCYQHPDIQEMNPEHILNRCSGSFKSVGTMRSGLLLEQDFTLEPDGLGKDSYSLPRPGALSWCGNGRPPGNTKSEAKAKKLGIIKKNEVFNPEWLEQEFGLPIGWTDPQEQRAATELLERVEQPSEIFWTLESPRLLGSDYSTSTDSLNEGNKKNPDCWCVPLQIVELIVRVLEQINLELLTSSTQQEKQSSSVLPVEPTSSTHLEKQSPLVLPVEPTSSTRLEKQPPSVLPVEPTSSTRLEKQPPSVLPVEPTSSTHLEKQPSSVLPVEPTSSTRLEKQPPSVLPVEPTSSTRLEKQSPSVLPVEPTSSTTRRSCGEGTGRIHWRTITKKSGKQYQQAWYDWQLKSGEKTIYKSTYISKQILSQVQQLESQKSPVKEILQLLGIKL